MQLSNEFVVEADLDRTWELLTDLERVMPCMPGATMEGRDGDDFLGSVKVKVGPITAQFRGTARYLDLDAAARTASIRASGKDPKGQATANALISARLVTESASRTRVFVDTDLDITGRMAQFGRGAIADVSNRLIGQFTDNLARELAGPQGGSGDARANAAAPTAPAAPAAAPDLNALALLGPTLAKGGIPLLVGLVLGLLLGRCLGRSTR